MKTTNLKTKSNQGSVLFLTISVMTIAVIVLGAYLMTVQQQVASVSRSQTWNASISLAEAGMEEGMAMVNYGSPNIIVNDWAWTNSLSTAGWVVNGTTAIKTNYVYGSNYYVAKIDWSNGNAPTVSAAGVVSYTPIPWVFSMLRSHAFLGQIGSSGSAGNTTNSTTVSVVMGRKIQVTTVNNPLFSAAIVCKTNFDMKGNGCTVDSFDSSSAAYSTGGMYDSTKRQGNGNVATDSVLTNSLYIGNGNIAGYVFTGPGSQQSCVEIGPNGVVGDVAFVNYSKNKGIEAGHWAPNFNMYIPDVLAPSLPGAQTSLPPATNGNITLTGTTSYILTSAQLNVTVAGTNTVWLNSHGSFQLGVTMTNGGQLILYVGEATGSSDSLSWSGNGTCNVPGYAKNLQIYGLPSLTSVDFHGNSAWIGCLYAPEANFTGGGGGNNNQDTAGAIVVNGASLNGHWNFHYDQSLTNSGPSRGWVATGWKEVPFTLNN